MIGDKPTHFVRRIHAALNPAGYNGRYTPKLHTIRKDEPDRWRAGLLIQFVVNNRRPNRIQFAEGKCTRIQYIQVRWFNKWPTVYIGDTEEDWAPFYFHDDAGVPMYGVEDMKRLAVNDGFESVEEFFMYFKENFKGKIIHWTDLKY